MKIKFLANSEHIDVFPKPAKAIKFAPDYYKNIRPQTNENPESGTVKRCVPFLDALSSGYIIPLWADMFVFAKGGELSLSFPQNLRMQESLGSHSIDQIPNHPASKKPYGELPMKFINPWIIETEVGVSCLFTAPLNHMESRFKILDGVVDTDTYYNAVNFPFLWAGGDGEFLIPKGTPLVQVIPFRREECEVEYGVVDEKRSNTIQGVLGTKLKNGYRDEFWHKRKSPDEQEE